MFHQHKFFLFSTTMNNLVASSLLYNIVETMLNNIVETMLNKIVETMLNNIVETMLNKIVGPTMLIVHAEPQQSAL